tara:strand:+ start:77 stop:379 length:303 start_codon:yes stop_codon:yes gene_type:complete
MRKITQDAIRAFRNAQNFKRGNTQVIVIDKLVGTERLLKLHGNTIAHFINGELIICDGGWQSMTTKERLNGFPTVNIHQKDFEWFLNGEAWNGGRIVIDW